MKTRLCTGLSKGSLRVKLILCAASIQIAMLVALVFSASQSVTQNLVDSHWNHVKEIKLLMGELFSGLLVQSDLESMHEFSEDIISSTRVDYIKVLDKSYEIVLETGSKSLGKYREASKSENPYYFNEQDHFLDDFDLKMLGFSVGSVEYEYDASHLRQSIKDFRERALIIGGAAGFMSVLVLVFLGWLMTRSLSQIEKSAKRIAQGDFNTKLKIEGGVEIRETAKAFNLMTQKLSLTISKLSDSEMQLKAIHQNFPGHVIALSNDFNILFVNKAFAGFTEEEIVGKLITDFEAYAGDAVNALLKKSLGESITINFDSSVQQEGSERIYYHNTITPLGDSGGKIKLLLTSREVTEQKRYQNQLEVMAKHDPLTKLANRVLLSERLNMAMDHARRCESILAVVYLDLDGFKQINDIYGHETGDKYLKNMAENLNALSRSGDTLARLGGDEFVCVFVNLLSQESIIPLLERLHEVVLRPMLSCLPRLSVSASVGVSFYPQEQEIDADQLLRQADQAMYQAKMAGKNQYVVYDHSIDLAIREQARWESAIREALSQDQFVLYYEPKVELITGKTIGVEALLRWQHPQKGLLEPKDFLSRVHKKQQAVELGQWVLKTVLKQLCRWQKQSFEISISFNADPRWLQSGMFYAHLSNTFARYPEARPELVEIEILETSAIDDLDKVKMIIHRCHQLGVSFVLDDFGTGYSSMNYLKNLPIKGIKIDKSFIKDVALNKKDQRILTAIMDIASVSGKTVIAEGVETKTIAEQLKNLSCQYAQGYAFGKAMPAAQVKSWVEQELVV